MCLSDEAGSGLVGLKKGEWHRGLSFCAFSGNRGKFVEVFLGSAAVGTTYIWQRRDWTFQSPFELNCQCEAHYLKFKRHTAAMTRPWPPQPEEWVPRVGLYGVFLFVHLSFYCQIASQGSMYSLITRNSPEDLPYFSNNRLHLLEKIESKIRWKVLKCETLLSMIKPNGPITPNFAYFLHVEFRSGGTTNTTNLKPVLIKTVKLNTVNK